MRAHCEVGREDGFDDAGSLGPLGVRPDLEGFYRTTLTLGSVARSAVADAWAVPASTAERALAEMTALGLIVTEGQDVLPVPPRIAVETLIQGRLLGMEIARRTAERLSTLYERSASPRYRATAIDVVRDGGAAVRAQ